MLPRPAPLSRSTSSSSVVTVSDDGSGKGGSKRTRKRFSQEQLIVLEHMFQKTSHPSKGEREAAAKQTGMDLKSVTIWFQNKRQTERKVTLYNSTNRGDPLANYNRLLAPSTALPPRPSSAPTFPSTFHLSVNSMAAQRRNSTAPPHPLNKSQSFLTLDRIASRSELPQLPTPATPPPKFTQYTSVQFRSRDANVPLWDAMPSSPLQPASPSSPFARDILDFAASKRPRKTGRRSLEWACASARVAEKAGGIRELPLLEDDEEMASIPSPPTTLTESMIDDEETDMDSTDGSEPHEIITPDSSQISMNVDWNSLGESRKPVAVPVVRFEDDIMNAAWALCGLSAGFSRS